MTETAPANSTSAREIVQALMIAAAGDAPEWSPAGLARGWVASIHGVEGHDSIAPGDPLADALHDAQMSRLNMLGETGSRNAADLAAKLAVVVLETADAARGGGDIPAALHRITSSALADAVLMGERPAGKPAEATAQEAPQPAKMPPAPTTPADAEARWDTAGWAVSDIETPLVDMGCLVQLLHALGSAECAIQPEALIPVADALSRAHTAARESFDVAFAALHSRGDAP